MMTGSVIIIGAGLSGLYAATLLEKAGVEYVILEARDRTGGRVLSPDAAGLHVDMGAAWFWPQLQPEFAQLIGQLRLTVIPQGRPGDMLYERHPDTPAQRYPAYETSPPSFRLMQVAQALTTALRHRVPANRIKLDQQVKSIIRTGEGMQVLAQTEAGEETLYTGEHIFLALPPALAGNITFSPALPEALLSHWRKIPTWMAPMRSMSRFTTPIFYKHSGFPAMPAVRQARWSKFTMSPSLTQEKRYSLALSAYRLNRDGRSAKTC